jgi:hypothetical protein
VNAEEVKRVFGAHNRKQNEVRWLATDDDGNRWEFVFNYRYKEWYVNDRAHKMSCFGKGGI